MLSKILASLFNSMTDKPNEINSVQEIWFVYTKRLNVFG